MSEMVELQLVKSARQRRIFLTFPWRIYRGDPLWVPPLLPERAKTIDPRRGAFFQRGEADFFIALRGGQPVGIICAAEDRAVNQQRGQSDCMFGFFECINDFNVAEAMIHHVAQWAKARGLHALYGPFNLDYEDSYGVLVEGRERPAVLLCGHTPPYYQGFFEALGFQPARGDNLAYQIEVNLDTPAMRRLSRLAERLRRRGWITIRSADLERWEEDADRVWELINASTRHLPDFIPWPRQAMRALLEQFRQVADAELVLFAEVKGQVVGWLAGIPNLNEAFQHANGLRYTWNYLTLWRRLRVQPECLALKSVLVLPEYWDTGVAVLLFDEVARRVAVKGYKWADLSLTSEDNPYTPALAEKAGAKIYKRYRVYRLQL